MDTQSPNAPANVFSANNTLHRVSQKKDKTGAAHTKAYHRRKDNSSSPRPLRAASLLQNGWCCGTLRQLTAPKRPSCHHRCPHECWKKARCGI